MARKRGSPWERVKKQPHLWRWRYVTGNGERREKFYARFTCKLKGKRRCEPLGGDNGGGWAPFDTAEPSVHEPATERREKRLQIGNTGATRKSG